MYKYVNPDWIICFGDHWGECTRGSAGNIMLEFNKRGKKILWINPIPKLNLSLNKTQGNKIILIKRIINKIKFQNNYFKKYGKEFFVLSPIYWPIVESRLGQFVNPKLYKLQIFLFKTLLNIRNYAVCNFTSNNVLKYITMTENTTFFHIAADMHSDLRIANEKQKSVLIKNEEILFNRAEKIFPASEEISKRIIEKFGHRDKIVILPHGVDVNHFLYTKEIHPTMLKFKRPIIGYFGALTFANDQDILKEIARNDFSLVLIGAVNGDYSELMKFENVHFMGPRSYKELPKYASAFDVCIMAWKPAAWINNCNPKKTLEYMALGKPIISMTISQIKNQFNEFIYFADDPKTFVNSIKLALSEDSQKRIEERKDEARKNDWAVTVQRIYDALGWVD